MVRVVFFQFCSIYMGVLMARQGGKVELHLPDHMRCGDNSHTLLTAGIDAGQDSPRPDVRSIFHRC